MSVDRKDHASGGTGRQVVFLWENFGPYHYDRCEAIAASLGPDWAVHGIELIDASSDYGWARQKPETFTKHSLFQKQEGLPQFSWERLRRMFAACFARRGAAFFLCHYENITTLLLAVCLRLTGHRVYSMGNSKFDDYRRDLFREVGKSLFLLPYRGFLTSSIRSSRYLRFLGIGSSRIRFGYNSVSIERVRRQAGSPPAPAGVPFADRHLTLVARLVPKKNLYVALEAYALYLRDNANPRPLHICGSGPLEASLRARAEELGISASVVFRGWLQAEDLSKTLSESLILFLPSIEEQYGNVVIEAQAMGLPVLLSENCGARDFLVRGGVNGFIVEADNPRGMAYFLTMVAEDEALWTRMAKAALATAGKADVAHFVDGVRDLLGLPETSAAGR